MAKSKHRPKHKQQATEWSARLTIDNAQGWLEAQQANLTAMRAEHKKSMAETDAQLAELEAALAKEQGQ